MTFTVDIERIAAGGDGVGHLEDGLVVFVPRSALGDRVQIEVTEKKANYARGRITSLLTPGSGRVDPPCTHYVADECGGCQLQHLSVERQCEAKTKIVGDALRRIGKLGLDDPGIIGSPRQWRYRTKVSLAAKHGRIGYRQFDRPASVFELEECLLANDEVMELWRSVGSNRGLLPDVVDSLVLRVDRDGGLHVLVVGGAEPWDAAPLADSVELHGISYWWKPHGGAARVVAGPETGYPAVAFEQMNVELANTIRRDVLASLGDLDGMTVWDLYAGVGDTAALLSFHGARVWSVDSDRSAVEWGRARFAESERSKPPTTRIVDRVEEAVARLPLPDVVVANPPRSGLGSSVTRWLNKWGAEHGIARMAYVSCDPATLARDLSRMPSLKVNRVQAYDLFPQTGHVETLTVLEAV